MKRSTWSEENEFFEEIKNGPPVRQRRDILCDLADGHFQPITRMHLP